MAFSKNILSEQTIRTISAKAFPDKNIASINELNQGCCNTLYVLEYEDGFKSILKVAPADKTCHTKNEANLMKTEAKALNFILGKISVKTPEVYFYDDSLTDCASSYIFMEYIPGETYEAIEKSLSKEEKERIDYKTGKMVKELTDITSDKFGFLGDDEHQFDTLCEFFEYLLNNVISDAEEKQIDYTISKNELLELFEKDRRCFEYMEQPCLVHFDMNQENILVVDKEVVGLVDWDKTIFGEPMMEERFRLQKYTLAFFEGFRQSQFNYRETRRLLWYDALFYLSKMCECRFRGCEDESIYSNALQFFKQSLAMLQISF